MNMEEVGDHSFLAASKGQNAILARKTGIKLSGKGKKTTIMNAPLEQ